MKSQMGYEFLKQTFAFDPDKRLTARDALRHKWFHEEPVPTANAFQSLPTHQIPPHRRITQDDTAAMMPQPTVNAANTHAQAAAQVQAQAQAHLNQIAQSHSAKGSAASFGSNGQARKKSRLA